MSKKTVVITSCNNCKGVIGDDQASYMYLVVSGRHKYEIDLCEACNGEFESLFTVPAPAQIKKATQTKPAKKKPKGSPCPECGREFANDHGVQVHVSRSHKK